MNMKNLIQQMTDIENSKKEQLNEAASITISAETGAEISDMLTAMQSNAGMQSKPAPMPPSLGMRSDMEKFRTAMDDDPKIPGKDDVDGDKDLQAGLIGALAGGALGTAAGAATGATGAIAAKGAALGAKAGSGIAGAMGKGIAGKMAGNAAGSAIGGAVGSAVPGAVGSAIGDKMTDNDPATEDDIEEYANEPDTQYGDMSDAIPDGNDLNRKKKSYPATQDGDNPMAVEAIKATLMAALAEKKMPMGPGPDGKKGTDDDKPAFLNQKTGDKKSKGGSKPKKGVVPPQFQKKGTDESGQTKDCPKCGAPGKKKLMACSSCGCS